MLLERCETHKAATSMKSWKFVDYDDHGNIHEVRCKFCGTTIMGWRQVGQPEIDVIPDQQHTRLITQKVALLRFGTYRELLIRFDDGSLHITPVCNDCVNKDFTPEQLEDCHLCDMEDLYYCCSDANQREVHEKLALRKPVGCEEHEFMKHIVRRIE